MPELRAALRTQIRAKAQRTRAVTGAATGTIGAAICTTDAAIGAAICTTGAAIGAIGAIGDWRDA